MNFSDSRNCSSILSNGGYNTTQILEEADLVLVNTCSIQDKGANHTQTFRKYNAVNALIPR
jgi:tRNA-2-methylthio-N6-dimethylallyladenosine synthase